MHDTKLNKPFGLIKLSILLGLTGLIIGGLLMGEKIIQDARVTKALNDIQSYETQYQTYQQNFGALPGDDSSAVTRFTNISNITNGDNSGAIGVGASPALVNSFASPGTENLQVWTHMRAASLIKNQIPNTAQPPNPFGGLYSFQNAAFIGFGAFTTTVLCLNNVPAAAAHSIDTQLDDGTPNTGAIAASAATVDGAVATDYVTNGRYVLCVKL
jgi:hypothetical protein